MNDLSYAIEIKVVNYNEEPHVIRVFSSNVFASLLSYDFIRIALFVIELYIIM